MKQTCTLVAALMQNFEKQTNDLPEKLESSAGYAILRYRASKLPLVLTGIGGGRGFGLARKFSPSKELN